LIDGEIGHVSDEFANNLRELPTGRLVLPGSWSTLSSRLEFGEGKSGSTIRISCTPGIAAASGLTLVMHRPHCPSIAKEGMEFNLTQGGQWLK
jgi:hypothetical protein